VSARSHPIAERDYWLEFYAAMPPDLSKPINCDHMTQLVCAIAFFATL
jgi:hypothetical protein